MPDDVIQIAFEALDKGLSKKIDDIGGKLDQLEGKVDTSAESFRNWDNVLDKSFDNVGTSAVDVSKKLESLGAATTDAAKIQHELEKAQNDVIASAQKLAEAQQALARNTDPSKHAELKREVSAAQVSLDNAAASVKRYSDEVNRMGETTSKAQGGFSKLQAGIVTANQALDLIQRGFGYAKDIIDQTIGSTVAYAKEVRDLSTNLGITTEETSKLIQAADDYGISVETVTGALQMAVKRGFAPNIETLAKLADEYNSIQDPVARAARLSEVFGRGWTSLTPILKAGGQAIREAAAEAEKLGLVLSDKDVQSARALEVQVDNLNDRWEALKIKMGKDLIPAAINVVDAFNKLGDILQGTEDPLDALNRQIEYAVTFYGRDSEAVKKLRAEYERLKKATEDVAMTNSEKLLRSNMAQITVSDRLRTGFMGINEAAKEQYGIYQNLTEAEKRLIAAREKFLELNRVHNAGIADAYNLAITYTESQRKQADVQKELDDLNEKIISHGARRVVTVKNEKLSAEELARTQLQLAAAQEDVAGAQKKAGETDVEFALRLDTLKGKVADYSQKLGEHTAVVGGATKAELEQKAALEGQIAALQKADEIDRAKGAFNSLTEAFRAGVLTQGQYEERAAALNAISGLYTSEALKQATAQEVLMKSFADPRSETWRGQLLLNQDAIDGQIKKTDDLAVSTKNATDAMSKTGIPVALVPKTDEGSKAAFQKAAESYAPRPIEVSIKPKIEAVNYAIDPSARTKLGHDLAGDLKYAMPVITPKIDTKQAERDLTNYVLLTDKFPKEKKINFVADTAAATRGAQGLLTLFGLTPAKKSTLFEIKNEDALKAYDDLYLAQERLHDKIIDIVVRYKSEGEPVSGFQHGGSYIVPANPRGGMGDYFPILAAPGERVTVQTKAQQNATPAPVSSGDTFVYNTNVYNPLAAAMLADKQRRDRLARSNARMGVA